MDVPLELSFHNIEPSEATEARIRERVEKLERIYGRLVACRVAVGEPHKQHRTGNTRKVRLDISVPGKEIVVNREPHRPQQTYAEPDVYGAIKDAFDAAERQLKEFKERRTFETKMHDVPLVGQILELRGEDDYGFLRSVEGRELYFHRNAVLNEDFDNLSVGDRVQYVETVGTTGPQASKVWRTAAQEPAP